MRSIFSAMAILAVLPLAAEKLPIERYESLIHRHPFGQPPEGFDPNRMAGSVSKNDGKDEVQATEEQQAIMKSVAFSVLNVEADGSIMVGFTDNSNQKSPKHYYLAKGASSGGWMVKEADPATKSMTVSKDGVDVTLTLGGNSSGVDLSKKSDAGDGRRKLRLREAGENAGSRPGGALYGMKTRREQRMAAEAREKADAEERRKREAAEAEEREREKAQREQDREEQRLQLEALREELRAQREAKASPEGRPQDEAR